jgi:hypothetical protein
MPLIVTRVYVQRVLRRVDASIQNGDINRSEGRASAFHGAVHSVRIADISGQRAILVAEIHAKVTQPLSTSCNSADDVSCLKKLCHKGGTDARASAGDKVMRHSVPIFLP